MITPAFAGLIVGIAWFAVFALAHISGCRAGWNNARMLVLGYPLSLAGSALTAICINPGSAAIPSVLVSSLISILVNSSFFVLYVPAVYTVLTSLSVQTMICVRLSGGSIPESDLYERFAGRDIIADRIATLSASGYICRDGGALRLTRQGRLVARSFAFIKSFWRLGAGG